MQTRCVAVFSIVVLVATMLILGGSQAPDALAQEYDPQSIRFQANARGDIDFVGNTLLTCPAGSNGCAAAQTSGNNAANNQYTMVNVDVDGLGSNSSTSTLTLPPGANVLFAGLYWGANSSDASRDQVSFRTPAQGYTTVMADTLDTDGGSNYQGFYDATAEVQAGGSGVYGVGNVAARTGRNAHAGWSMMVVYEDTSLPFRNLTVYDGFARVNSANPVQITVDGFLTPVTGPVTAKVTNVVYEGDDRYSGDQMLFEGNVLGDGSHPSGNFFNSRISKDGVLFNDKGPNYVDQLGFDIARVDVTGLLANSQTSATIDYTSAGDWYYVGVVASAIDIFVPDLDTDLEKSFSDLNGGAVVPGDVIEYVISSANLGQDPAVNVIVNDPIPGGTTFVNGSLQIVNHPDPALSGTTPTDDPGDGDGGAFDGTAAEFSLNTIDIGEEFEIRFQVTVDAGTEFSTIPNTAELLYQGATLPDVYSNTGSVEFPVEAAADLVLVSKVDSVDPVIAGETFDYTITVRNDGPSPSIAPVISDALPAGLIFSSGPGCVAGPPVSCTLADIAPNATGSVTIAVQVDPAASATTVTNTASVESPTTPDPDPTNNAGSETTEIVRETDVSILKADAADPVLAGQTITYTLTVSNAGPSTATDTVVTDALPTGTTLQSATFGGSTCAGTALITCDLGELDAPETVVITVVVVTDDDLADPTTLSNTASVTTTTPDSDPGNNSAVEETTVNRLADLVLDKVGPTTVNAGELVSYTIAATNNGPSISENAVIVDVLPAGFIFDAATSTPGCVLSAAPSEVTCGLGDLDPGAAGAKAVTISALVPADAVPAVGIVNSATVTDDDGNTASATHPVEITREVDLNIAKSDLVDPVAAGTTLSYEIVVSNDGPSDAAAVSIVDALPPEVTFNSAAFVPAGDGTCAPGATVSCQPTGGVLAAGASATILVVVDVPASLPPGTLLTNTATITSTEDPVGATATEETGSFNDVNLTIGKVATPNPVIAGETVTYTITFNNAGPSDAQATEILDTLPGEVAFSTAAFSPALDGSCTHDGSSLGGAVTCLPNTLTAGQTVTVVITGTVAASTVDGTDIVNQVTGSADDPNNPGERLSVDADATVNVQRSADLSAEKTVTPNPVTAGESVTYTIDIANAGPSDASGILALDPLPLGLTVLTPLPAGCSDNAGTINCDVGVLAAGGSTSFDLVATVDASADPGSDLFPNTVTVTANEPDPNPDNNEDTVAVDVETEVGLSITKVDNVDPVVAGETVVYTIEVANSGPSDADAVTISDTPPAGLTFDAAASSTGCVFNDPVIDCAVGSVAPGATASVNLVFTVDAGASPGTVTNSASVVSDEDPVGVTATEETTIETRADLAILKTAAPTPVVPGENITYTIEVENKGPSDALAATVTDILPSDLVFQSVDPVASCSHDGAATGGTVSCALGDFVPDQTATITIVATVDPATTSSVANAASAASSTTDPNEDNNTSTATTPVLPQADVAVTKVDNADPVTAGLGLSYTITASNAGPSAAETVVITDTLPAQVSFVSAPGCSHSGEAFGGTVTCALGSLAPAASVPFVITTSVDPTTTSTLASNSVEITTTTTDTDPSNNTDSETTVIEAVADLGLSKSVTPNPVLAGEQATYTISISNAGPSSAQAVNVNDQLPAGMSFVSANVVAGPATCTGTPGAGGSVACGFGTLDSGQSRTVEILVDVLASASGTQTNTADASSPTDPTPPSASAPVTILTSADLVMTEKTDNVDPAIAGQPLVWTLSIRNDGPSDAVNSTITDTLPAGVTYNAAGSTPGCTIASGVVTCPTGTLAPGETATVNIGVIVDATTTGTIENTGASTQSDTTDPDDTNNSQSESTAIETQSQVTAVKTADPDPVVAGENLTYEIVVNNEGPSVAADSVLTDPLPSGTTLISAATSPVAGGCTEPSAGLVNCQLGDLAVNSPITVTIVVATSSDLLDGASLQNTATINWLNGGPTTAPTSSGVERLADLVIEKSDREDPVAAGTDIVWDLVATNNGPSDATNVVITDALPANTVFNPALSSSECQVNGTNVVCSLTSLAAGDTAQFVVAATADSAITPGTVVTNEVDISADETDPTPGNNTATEDTTVTQVNDLAIVKTDSPDPVVAGEPLTWTVTVTNNGPSNASGVELADTLPAGVTFVPFAPGVVPSSDPGCTLGGGVVTCGAGSIAAGDSVDISIVGDVDPAALAGSSVTNTVEISAFDGTDPNPNNNTDNEPTSVQREAGIVLSKNARPSPVVAGQNITYVLRLQNDGPSDGSGVLIQDTIPADTEFVSVNVLPSGEAATCSENTGTISCTPDAAGATLAANGFIEVEVVVTANSSLLDGANVANTATASSTDVPPDFDPVEAQATTPVTRVADLSLDKVVNPDAVVAGESVTYTLTVTNAGPSDATDVAVDDILPQGVTFVSSVDGCTASGPSVSCAATTVAAGDTASFSFVAEVASDFDDNSGFTNNAIVDAVEQDPNDLNNVASVPATVTRVADLAIAKSDGGVTGVAGESVAYTIDVSNAGPSQASGVQVTDPVPTGTTFDPAGSTGSCTENAGIVTCDLAATLDVGESATVIVAFLLDDDLIAGSVVSNTATATANETDPSPNEATDTTPTATSADVSIVKDAIDTMAVAGTDMTWTLQVSNSGPSVARNVTVTDSLASGLTGVSATPEADCTVTDSLVTCTFAIVEVGETIGITVVTAVDPDQTDPVTNSASVTTTTPDPNPSNDQSALVEVPVGLQSDLVIDKSSAPDPIIPGQPITYTLVVTNNGPSTVTGATVADTTPAEAVEPVASCVVDPADGTCTETSIFPETSFLVDLAPNTSATITIDATVDPDAVEAFLNTATVTVPPGVTDPIPENNIDDDGNNTRPTVVTDLSVTKSSSPSPAVAGEPITYRIEVTNDGPSTAAAATIMDAIPAEILNPSAVCTVDPDEGSCSVSVVGANLLGQYSLDPGAALMVMVTGTVDPSVTTTIANTVTVEPGLGATDPDDTNNIARDFNSPSVAADVAVTKVGDEPTATAGTTTSWTIGVVNNGPSTATGVSVTDLLPAGLTLVSEPANCTDGVCDVGTLLPGAEVELVIETAVDADWTDPIVNSVTATATSPDPDPDNNAAEAELPIVVESDLSVLKTSSPDPFVSGVDLTYTIVVANAGPSDAVDATVFDTVPAEVLNPVASCASVTSTTSCAVADGGQNAEFTVSIPVGESVTMTIMGTVDPDFSGSVQNTASVAPGAGASDPTPSNNTGINQNPSAGVADLQVDKSLRTSAPQTDTRVTWLIDVSNNGPSTVSGAQVVDMLPRGVRDAQWTCTVIVGVGACETGSGVDDVDVNVSLASGATVQILVDAYVWLQSADLTNTATVTPPPGVSDPNSENDVSTVVAVAAPTALVSSSPPVEAGTPLDPTVPSVPASVPVPANNPLAVTGTDARNMTLISVLLMIAGTSLALAGDRRRRLLSQGD